MAVAKKNERLSPLIKVHPPATKPLAAEEKTEEAELILRRLQLGSMTSLSRVADGRRQSCIQLGLSRNNEDTKTIRAKVKSTENLNAKSLIGADLLKNLKKINAQSVFESRKVLDPRRCQTAEVYSRSAINTKNSPDRTMSAVQRKTCLFPDFGSQNRDSISQEALKSPQHKAFDVQNRKRLLSRRGSLPLETMKNKKAMADAILQKYNTVFESNEHLKESGRMESDKNKLKVAADAVTASLPLIKRVRSAETITDRSLRASKELDKENKPRSVVDATNHSRRSSVVNTSRSPSSNSCGSDDVDEVACKRVESSDSSDESDQRSKRGKKMNFKKAAKSRSSKKKRSDSDSSGSESQGETDEDESLSEKICKNSTRKEKQPNIKRIDNNNNSNETVDDKDESETDCVDESRDLSSAPTNKISVPGMPALDISEVQETKRTSRSSKAANTRHGTIDSEANLADDVDDLIDTIDDLIEADDEDIAYEASMENKQARKNKTFKKTAALVMTAKRIHKS